MLPPPVTLTVSELLAAGVAGPITKVIFLVLGEAPPGAGKLAVQLPPDRSTVYVRLSAESGTEKDPEIVEDGVVGASAVPIQA